MTCINKKHKRYPVLLREIHDPPSQLFIEGEMPAGPIIAIVGTRKPTVYGREVAYRLAYDLAQAGCITVSGLAYGIDSIVHQATLDAGGKTIAVMATGLDRIYPAAHRGLAREIVASGGAIVTEYPEGTPGMKHQFPARNRIIAGMTLGTLVPEADARSGSLITAFQALDSNRIVMAVPGNITSERSAGPNNLIRAGAVPVLNADDVWSAVGLDVPQPQLVQTEQPGRTGLEGEIVGLLTGGAMQSEAVAGQLDRPIPAILSALTLLEMTGAIKNIGGNTWMLRSADSAKSLTSVKAA